MLPKNRIPTHPGEILLEEYLILMDLSHVKLAAHIGVPVQGINEIVRGKRGITPETTGVPVPGQTIQTIFHPRSSESSDG